MAELREANKMQSLYDAKEIPNETAVRYSFLNSAP